MAAGDFSASFLADIIQRQEEMWKNSRVNNVFDQPIETAKTLAMNQQVAWQPLMVDARSCVGHKVHWLKSSNNGVEDRMTTPKVSCDITGPELEADSKIYQPTFNIGDTFSVLESDCKGAYTPQEKIAYQMMWTKTKILTALNQKFIAFLEANLMVNAVDARQNGTWHAGTNATYYASNAWNADLMAELNLAAILNKINSPLIINGTNFFNANFNSQFNKLNDNQKDQNAKFAHFNMYWDPRNIDTTVGAKATYVVDPGVIGFFNQNQYYTTAPERRDDALNTHTWQEEVPQFQYMNNGQLTPLKVDVSMIRKCTMRGDLKDWGWFFDVSCRGGLVSAPLNVSTDKGILKFVNGSVPS